MLPDELDVVVEVDVVVELDEVVIVELVVVELELDVDPPLLLLLVPPPPQPPAVAAPAAAMAAAIARVRYPSDLIRVPPGKNAGSTAATRLPRKNVKSVGLGSVLEHTRRKTWGNSPWTYRSHSRRLWLEVTFLDLAQLRYFHAIAHRGSFTAAARELKVSQPTLTVAVKHLEEQLKTTLFHRGREGVKLTGTGQALLEDAARIFDLLDKAEERIVTLQEDEAGRFVVGCHESLGAYFLPSFMRPFLEACPRIEIKLWNGTSAGVTEGVLGRQVDFGLVVNPEPHDDLVLVELFHDAVDVMIAASSLPGGRPLWSPESIPEGSLAAAHARLREGPLVFAGRVGQAQELKARLGKSLLPARLLSCGDLELVKSLALEGVGPALLPRRVAAYGQRGKLVRLHPDLPFIADIICLVYRADLHRTRAAIRLKEALVQHGRSLPRLESLDRPADAGLSNGAESVYR